MDVNGAIITVTPQRQLEHGWEYELRTGDGSACPVNAEFCSTFNRIRFTTPNNLQADAAPSPAVASPGQTIALKSNRSFSTNSTIAQVRWSQTSGTPVQLLDANLPTASFAIPGAATDGEALKFELIVEDANGEIDAIPVTVFVMFDLTQPFYYHRRAQGAAAARTPEGARLTSTLIGPVLAEFVSDHQFQFSLLPSGSIPYDSLRLWNFSAVLDMGTFTTNQGARIFPYDQYLGCNDPDENSELT